MSASLSILCVSGLYKAWVTHLCDLQTHWVRLEKLHDVVTSWGFRNKRNQNETQYGMAQGHCAATPSTTSSARSTTPCWLCQDAAAPSATASARLVGCWIRRAADEVGSRAAVTAPPSSRPRAQSRRPSGGRLVRSARRHVGGGHYHDRRRVCAAC